MLPVVTPQEMAALDAAAQETQEELIERAGAAVAHQAKKMLPTGQAHQVMVIVGPGANGADGRVAARHLTADGQEVTVAEAHLTPSHISGFALVIDAAFGTGLRRPYQAPTTDAPVLAVDLPSGLDGLTGRAIGQPAPAQRTVTFAAAKPGHFLGQGPSLCGDLVVADIGLDVSWANCWFAQVDDVAGLVPSRPSDAHKWQSACWVIAGHQGMEGAAYLASRAAQRAGAGYVRLSVPGETSPPAPLEVVVYPLYLADPLEDPERFAALVLGPGLGPSEETSHAVQRWIKQAKQPMVVDGDGLRALVLADEPLLRNVPLVMTPHDGEYRMLAGQPPAADRLESARTLAQQYEAVVLLKGPTTVIADPAGATYLVRSGDQRLATAGTGDVLSGIIGGFLARGAQPWAAAVAGAQVHGALLDALPNTGVVAGDLDAQLPAVLSRLGVDA